MFAIVVRLEERCADIQLKHDAADAPNVTGLRPAELENHFWRAIMTCADNRAMMLMVKCCAAKIN
jgi:hypothetical protein